VIKSAPTSNFQSDDAALAGSKINLIRAVSDQADGIIKGIDRELVELERRREQLITTKAAHEEMLAVAQKFSSLLTVTITTTQK